MSTRVHSAPPIGERIRLGWRVLRSAAGRRLVIAVARNPAVRRSLRSATGRERIVWLALDDPRIRLAAFDALEQQSVRAAILAVINDQATRAGQPAQLRMITRALDNVDRRADLRRALQNPMIRRELAAASERSAAGFRAVAVIKVLAMAAGPKIRGVFGAGTQPD